MCRTVCRPDRRQLRKQRTIHDKCSLCLRSDSAGEGAIGNLAGVPHRGPSRMHDQEALGHHVGSRQLAGLEAHGVTIRDVDLSAVEDRLKAAATWVAQVFSQHSRGRGARAKQGREAESSFQYSTPPKEYHQRGRRRRRMCATPPSGKGVGRISLDSSGRQSQTALGQRRTD